MIFFSFYLYNSPSPTLSLCFLSLTKAAQNKYNTRNEQQSLQRDKCICLFIREDYFTTIFLQIYDGHLLFAILSLFC